MLDQPVAYTSLASDTPLTRSLEHQIAASRFEHQPRATTQSAYATPTYIIAQLDSFECASSTAEVWGILMDTGASTSVAPKSFASDIELSPAPSTLQLTTATGKAIKTYGLRKVHLQSRGLSLEVSVVIADVVTPLLGLDIMIKDSLNLQIEHGLHHFLVHPAGDKTQLELIGRHPYLIACPSQHGSSHCFIGSLSQVIGFLPADKDLHEQMLASRSSSSIDLDEDTSEASEEEDDDLSFDLVPGKGEVADTGGEPKVSFYPKCLQQSMKPSTQERELHNITHISFPWCVRCQEAKDRAFSTRSRELQQRLPTYSYNMLTSDILRQRPNRYPYLGGELDRSCGQLDHNKEGTNSTAA